MTIPAFELTRQYHLIQEEIETALLRVLRSGRYIGGAIVKEFEQQFAHYIGVSQCVACNSGTDALLLALRALQIKSGDEVITTAFSFIATAEAISLVGATPVFVDIDLNSFNIDADKIEAAITPNTKAILLVHLFGQPVNMTKVEKMAQAHSLDLIEDCAQAHGAEWAGKKVGSIGRLGCFSFYPTKNLGACGDGGAVTTNDPALAARIKMLADHGRSDRYRHSAVGINSRLDAVQAAALQIKLRYLNQWNQQRCTVAQRYRALLEPIPGIKIPQELEGGNSVWNQYTILVEEGRDRLQTQLQHSGIGSTVYYPLPLHQQPAYQSSGSQKSLPRSEQAADQALSLPMFPELTVEEQQQIVYCIKDCFEQENGG